MNTKDEYVKLLGLTDDDIVSKIKDLSSKLSDEEHIIRSCIFDLHAIIEQQLKELFKKTFRSHLFFTDDIKHNQKIVNEQEKALNDLSFMTMWRCLKPTMTLWCDDFKAIEDINKTRNLTAHGDIEKVVYKGKNPFKDKDCLCHLFFDVWAITQQLPKYVYFTTEKDQKEYESLKKRYDALLEKSA